MHKKSRKNKALWRQFANKTQLYAGQSKKEQRCLRTEPDLHHSKVIEKGGNKVGVRSELALIVRKLASRKAEA